MKCAYSLEVAYCTDRGLLRANNEDAVFVDAGLGLAILADGMGGYNAGEVASVMATSQLAENLGGLVVSSRSEGAAALGGDALVHRISSEILAVNCDIFNVAQSAVEYVGMGTTLVLAFFHVQSLTVAHVGDSRLYRMRAGRLELLTHDHSLLQERLDNGMITPVQAEHADCKGLLTRALGVAPWVEPEIHQHDLMPGDLFLLCSDGLNEMVRDALIGDELRGAGESLQEVADELVQIALDHGGRDNVSVILVRVGGSAPVLAQGWWQQLKNKFK